MAIALAVASGTASAESKASAAAGVEMSPTGSIHITGAPTASTDLSVGLDAAVLYRPTPIVAVGFAPRYVWHIAESGEHSTMQLVDLRAIVQMGTAITPKVSLFGLGGLGYSILFPSKESDLTSKPTGLTISFGVGGGYAVTPTMRVTTTLGYELGRQKTTVSGQDIMIGYDQIMLAFGIETAF